MKATPGQTPNYLYLTSYDYESFLNENRVIEHMRETKLQQTKARYMLGSKNANRINGNQLGKQLSLVDINYVKGNRDVSSRQTKAFNPTQIAVKARIKDADRRLQRLGGELRKAESIDNLRSNLIRLNTFKSHNNIHKLMGSQSKKKIPDLKTTTIDKDFDRIPYNRYMSKKNMVSTANDFLALNNKENLRMNTGKQELLSENRKSTVELPQVNINAFNKTKGSANGKFNMYKDKGEITKMLTRHEDVNFAVVKKKLAMQKKNNPKLSEVDQWNMDYFHFIKN